MSLMAETAREGTAVDGAEIEQDPDETNPDRAIPTTDEPRQLRSRQIEIIRRTTMAANQSQPPLCLGRVAEQEEEGSLLQEMKNGLRMDFWVELNKLFFPSSLLCKGHHQIRRTHPCKDLSEMAEFQIWGRRIISGFLMG